MKTKRGFTLVELMVVLTVIRGLFSREILYAPGFAIGLGLAIGFCMIKQVWPVKTA